MNMKNRDLKEQFIRQFAIPNQKLYKHLLKDCSRYEDKLNKDIYELNEYEMNKLIDYLRCLNGKNSKRFNIQIATVKNYINFAKGETIVS